jgi:aminoglycoside 3-N-acetyltransferase
MITYRELATSFRALGLERTTPVIAYASLPAFGPVNGGVDTLLGALLSSFDVLAMPVFTHSTMLIPEVGPVENGMLYGSGRVSNSAAEFFRPDMPADRFVGPLAESLRRLPQARRSSHPILSFAGINADTILASQSLAEPLEPVHMLVEGGGWVLLLGTDHIANISLHYAEQLAGRKQFIRWALTPYGVVECPNMPGCSNGFNAIAPRVRRVTRQVQTGETIIQAIPLTDLISIARAWIEADPLALLCEQPDCVMCQAVRSQVVRV